MCGVNEFGFYHLIFSDIFGPRELAVLQNSLCSCLYLVLIKLGEIEEVKVDNVLDKIFCMSSV